MEAGIAKVSVSPVRRQRAVVACETTLRDDVENRKPAPRAAAAKSEIADMRTMLAFPSARNKVCG